MSKRMYVPVAIALVLILGGAVFFLQRDQQTNAKTSAQVLAETDVMQPDGSLEVSSDAEGKGKTQSRQGERRAYSLKQEDQIQAVEGPARDVISKLRPQAEAGDSKAAMALYMTLTRCYDVLTKELSEEEVEIYRKANAEKGLLEGWSKRIDECRGIPVSDLEDRGRWLEQAADSGLLQAQLMYAANPRPIIGDATEMIRNPQKVQRYKEKAMGYLEELAAKGNTNAMMSLAGFYDNGILVGKDPIKSYAYYKAVSLADPDPNLRELVEMQGRKIPASTRGKADELAQIIYRRCCAN
jgi:hypothetical protein